MTESTATPTTPAVIELATADAECRPEGVDALTPLLRRVVGRLHALRPRLREVAEGGPQAGAVEWLVDNWFIIADAMRRVERDLPGHFARQLPRRAASPDVGLPRAWRLARLMIGAAGDFLEPSQGAVLVEEYQRRTPLTLGELWAIPALLRLAILEDLAACAAHFAGTPTGAAERGAVDAPVITETRVAACVTGLRRIATYDWKTFVEAASRIEALLRQDPAGAHARGDFATRDRYRKVVEQLARWAATDERVVAAEALALSREAAATDRARHVGYFLVDAGRATLERRLGCAIPRRVRWRRWIERHATASYLGAVMTLTVALAMPPVLHVRDAGTGLFNVAVVALLVIVPALGVAVPAVNWLVTQIFPPRLLPRLDFEDGVPAECRTLVAVPTLLTIRADVDAMLRQLELNYQGNADPAIRFVLLADAPDAATPETPEDAPLLAAARAGVDALNRRYPSDGDAHFLLLYRPRRWNAAEGCWMGWERKRGKLSELNRLLLGDETTDLVVEAGGVDALRQVRYVITLDADTVLPGGVAARLIGAFAHPLNAATFDASGRVRAGYTVLQPRVEVAGRSAGETPFARIFEGDTGLDLYGQSTSDAYQDLFGAGIYAGKGIYDVAAFERSLAGRVPDNALLSHDLFEGIHGRAAFVSNVQLLEDFPSHVLGYVRRLHRWVRGDWQLLPWLGRRVPLADGSRARNRLALIDRWKIVDNLRRSLTAPAVLALLVLGWLALPGSPWFWTLVAAGTFAIPIALGAATSANRLVAGAAWRPTVTRAMHGVWTDALRWLLALVLLVVEAATVLDAVARTLTRLVVTRRHLLEWQSAALTARALRHATRAGVVWRQTAASPTLGLVGAGAVLVLAPASLPSAIPFLLAWLVAPEVAHVLSRPLRRAVPILTVGERARLRRVARRTWLYFERILSPDHAWLAPDHVQEAPIARVADRTSPTNIGLGLLSTFAAYDLGYLGLRSLGTTLTNKMDGLAQLQRFRGHFFNWTDLRTREPLRPRYISMVDSGNLAAALVAVRQGCLDLARAPVVAPALWRGLADTLDVFRECVERLPPDIPETATLTREVEEFATRLDASPTPPVALASATRRLRTDGIPALERALADVVEAAGDAIDPVRLRELRTWIERLRYQTDRVLLELDALAPWAGAFEAGAAPAELPHRFPTLAEAAEPPAEWTAVSIPDPEARQRYAEALAHGAQRAREVLTELHAVAERTATLVAEMDFGFLYNRDRQVFHIGYDVDAGRLDNSYYDLLASEARLSSLVAIAKRDVPERHWLHLGRPFGRVGGRRVLLSWGGTMFEYLMPSLLVEQPDQSLLAAGCEAAIHTQERFGRRHGIPWGISESAFDQLGPDGQYQYRAFGVPGLGLKHGLGDRLVVAPYASLLGLPIAPRNVVANLRHLETLGAVGPYGLYEALDFGVADAGPEETPSVVRAYMSHHQGMILVALANHLAGNATVRRFQQDARIASVEYLLFEQVPRHVPIYRPEMGVARIAPPRRARYAAWPVHPAATPQLHILSNGRYSVLLTGKGGGGSRWRGRALSRWRAESGVDQWGHWIYLQDRDHGTLWSVGAQPVHDGAGERSALFSPAAAEYRARAHGIAARVVVTVPPGDDVEIRRVTLTNESRRARRIALTGVFEVSLAPPSDDLRHQAFAKLFVESEIHPRTRSMVFRRRPGGPDPAELFLGHVVVAPASVRVGCTFETDRARFFGPGGSARRPAALVTRGPLTGTAGATLDPLAAARCTLDIGPGQEVSLAFVTGVAESRDEILSRVQTYASWSHIERAFEEAAVQAEGALNALNVLPDEARIVQRLFSALIAPDARLRPGNDVLAGERASQHELWRFGISGDRPILVVRATGERASQLAVIRTALKAHALLRRKGCEIDLVLLDEVSAGYEQPYYERLGTLITEAGADPWRGRSGGVFVIRASELSPADRRLIESAARVVLDTLRTIAEQLAALDESPPRLPAFTPVRSVEPPGPAEPAADERLVFDNGLGGFTPDGREYVLRVDAQTRPPRAWVHVVSNPTFGFIVSASGGGFTWAVNSAERRLTPWRNDPVMDVPGEILYLRDEETGEVWSSTPAPAGPPGPCTVRFGRGYASFARQSHGLRQTTRLLVPPDDPVKLIEVTLENTTDRLRRLTATYYVEWVLGTSRHRTGPHLVPEYDHDAQALIVRNPFHPSYAARVAFLTASAPPHGLTTDRIEFVGPADDPSAPAALRRIGPAGTVRAGGDACGALQIYVQLEPGERRTVHFALGDGADRDAARRLAIAYHDPAAAAGAREASRAQWETLLDTVTVHTPDPALDVMLNGWLLYQATACRLWARSALSQSSGAFGFRDQLQDILALAPIDPPRARAHILEAAAHQFQEGDVLHWWHPGSGEGVRTRCSDDLLWLPYAAAHYATVTGNAAIFDEPVPYLSGSPLRTDEDDRYGSYARGASTDSLYDHCLRALDHADRRGVHGLPLFGTGDWNDGMNRVGAHGRGESVWLAWFFAATLRAFASIAARREDPDRAADLRARADAIVAAAERDGWDGGWYRRGYYDDGAPLGSVENSECRIDAIAQAWAVLSGAGDPDRAEIAMRSVERELSDEHLRLVRLFWPPFDRALRDPGYIRAYPPGVRENGGQYTHAAIWVAWATGLLGQGDRLGELLHWLNPVNRTATWAGVERYRGEPYVVAADISTALPRPGAAGWTWYTGSASWMYRLGVEILLGLRRDGDGLVIDPHLPTAWQGFDATWRHGATEYRIHVRNPDRAPARVLNVTLDGVPLASSRIPLDPAGGTHEVDVRLGADASAPKESHDDTR